MVIKIINVAYSIFPSMKSIDETFVSSLIGIIERVILRDNGELVDNRSRCNLASVCQSSA